jgi:hypothetical protein
VYYSRAEGFSLDKYRNDHAYTYEKSLHTVNYWDRFWDWLMRKLRVNPSSVLSAFFNRNLWYIIFIVIVIFIIIKLFGSEIKLFFYRSRKVPVVMQTLEEDIHEINFEDQIQAAVSQGNFRFAVRLYYLKSLKELNERELIQWEKNKTNRDYYYELSGHTLQAPFAGITHFFNWIWYGDKPVDQLAFQEAKEQFNHFHSMLKVH